eukprot:s5100_g2.t1
MIEILRQFCEKQTLQALPSPVPQSCTLAASACSRIRIMLPVCLTSMPTLAVVHKPRLWQSHLSTTLRSSGDIEIVRDSGGYASYEFRSASRNLWAWLSSRKQPSLCAEVNAVLLHSIARLPTKTCRI